MMTSCPRRVSRPPGLDRLLAVMLAAGLAAAAAAEQQGTFRVSRLVCVIGNNAESGAHRAGYNGLFRLATPDREESAFHPAYAGLNLEHYFDARDLRGERVAFFEPRHAPMEFRRLGPTTAELHQAATPVFRVESRTRFELREPYYIDVTYTARPLNTGYAGGFLGVFWASYLNAPEDKSMYFLQEGSTLASPQWVQFCTPVHGRDSTVRGVGDRYVFPPGEEARSLFRSLSPLRYAEPFFYGRIREMVLIYIFRPTPHLRFAHSPSGGSRTPAGDDTNPAWDFQLVAPEAEARQGLRLAMRVVYKPWAGRADVLREVREWLATPDQRP
jgi:hypothetical protein